MDKLFDLCVAIMQTMAENTGLSYKEINIWLFVIIHPVLTLVLIMRTVYLRVKILVLNQERKAWINKV
jgi:hypothetical protein